MAAVLERMPGAVISHQSAAYLHQLVTDEPRALHVTIPHGTARHRLDGVVLHQSLVPESLAHQGFQVMTLARTAVVCAADILNPHDAAGLLYRAVHEFGVSPEILLRHAALAPRGGRAAVSRAARELASGARSVPEGIIWTACWETGLPVPELNARVRASNRTYYLDGLFREFDLAIEIDGKEHHSSPEQKAGDAYRQKNIERLGIRVLRFPASQVLYRPATVMSDIMWALQEFRPLHAWLRRYERPLIKCGVIMAPLRPKRRPRD